MSTRQQLIRSIRNNLVFATAVFTFAIPFVVTTHAAGADEPHVDKDVQLLLSVKTRIDSFKVALFAAHLEADRKADEAEAAKKAAEQATAKTAPKNRPRTSAAQGEWPGMWDALANCETGGDWQNGGQYGGGLGIYVGSWRAYGGLKYAPTPQQATKDQQIDIARNIAKDGYGGWGCADEVGLPGHG